MGLWVNTVDRILFRFVEKTATCWLWKGKKDYGYGRVAFEGKHVRAHRLIYETSKGAIPSGMVLDHLCRNHACVNPDHLEPVTTKENVRRGLNGDQKTHCKHGHPLSGENLYYHARSGQRFCRVCCRERSRRWKLTRKQVAA